jgi:hypothetical protein
MQENGNAIRLVTAQVHERVASWYGCAAEILTTIPEVKTFRRSFFLRYQISLEQRGRVCLLIKIPRPPEAASVAQALELQRPRNSVRKEFDFLQACEKIFTEADPQKFCAVRAIGFLPEWNAIAMEELNCRPLRIRNLYDKYSSVHRIKRAAQWLRIFHERIGETEVRHITSSTLRDEFNNRFAALESASPMPIHEVAGIRQLMELRLASMNNIEVPFAYLHGDFKWGNIVLSKEGRVGAVDSKLRGLGPIYVDLARLMSSVLSARVNYVTFGMLNRYQDCKDAVIGGYFNGGNVDAKPLDCYSALFLLEKWHEHERTLQRFGHNFIFRIPTRKYFTHLLTQCLG